MMTDPLDGAGVAETVTLSTTGGLFPNPICAAPAVGTASARIAGASATRALRVIMSASDCNRHARPVIPKTSLRTARLHIPGACRRGGRPHSLRRGEEG